MSRKVYTDAELDILDKAEAARKRFQRRMAAIDEKLEAIGISLDELIELIRARKMGDY